MSTAIDLPTAFSYFLKEEAGGSLMEYTLIAALIIVVCVLALLALRKIA